MKKENDETSIQFYDEGRRRFIYDWAKKRSLKDTNKIKNHLRLFLIDGKVISGMFGKFNIFIFFNMLIAGIFSYLCIRFDIGYFFQVSLFLQIFSLSISFLVMTDFSRRSRALFCLAELRAQCLNTLLVCREWKDVLKVPDSNFTALLNLFIKFIIHVHEYLQTRSLKNKKFISEVVYEDISDISFEVRRFSNEKNLALDTHTTAILGISNQLARYFEKLRILKDYKSPLTQRALTKFLALFLPLIFAPFIAYSTQRGGEKVYYPGIFLTCLQTFILGQLVVINDRLHNPFQGKNGDDIDMGSIYDWINDALIRINNRKISLNENQEAIIYGSYSYSKELSNARYPYHYKGIDSDLIKVEMVKKRNCKSKKNLFIASKEYWDYIIT